MAIQTLTLHLPDDLYELVKQRAAQTNQSIEDAVVGAIKQAVTASDDLDPELEQAMDALTLLDDERLWQVARSHLSTKDAATLTRLNSKKQRTGLTPQEIDASAELLKK